MTEDRPVSKVFSDIVSNAQEIVRAEILLARTEALDEVVKAKPRIVLIGSGVLAGVFAALFLLDSAYYGLMEFLPAWSAAMVVGAAMAIAAALLLKTGMKGAEPGPAIRRPVDVLKENH